jgi:hypothetical protein
MNIDTFVTRYGVRKQDSGCWLWTRARNKGGYGQLMFEGVRNRGAHRVAYELANGPIPEGLLVCHRCDVKNCVNPAHLFLGSVTDNNRDREAKGRGDNRRAERCPTHKLTWADIRAIRADTRTQKQIARAFGIAAPHVSVILNNRVWIDENYKPKDISRRCRLRGIRHPNGKLTDRDIAAIRRDRRPLKAIASDYGVTPSHICQIRKGNVR